MNIKRNILLISVIIWFAGLASGENFLYTFQSETFNGTITKDTVKQLLNNRIFYIKTNSGNKTVNCQFVPGRGLRITTTSTEITTFTIYTKTSDTTMTGSMSIETNNLIIISFDKVGDKIEQNTYSVYSGTSTITHTYPSTGKNVNIVGPKIFFKITNIDTIYIKSFQFNFGTTPQRKTITLVDGSTVIGSFTTYRSTLPFPLPTISTTTPDLHHVGWTYDPSSTDYITEITDTSSLAANTTLHALYAHPYSTAKPDEIRIYSLNSSNNAISHQLTLPSPSHIAYAHFHGKNPSAGLRYTYSLLFDNGSYSVQDTDITIQSHFFSLPFEGLLPVSDALTISISNSSNKPQSYTLDSVIIGYIPDTDVNTAYFTTAPSSPYHINLHEGDNITEPATATDDISYTMTIDDSRYFFFSLPFDVPYSGIRFTPLSGPFPSAYYSGYEDNQYIGDWVISDYDEATNSWHDIELADLVRDGLVANHGYTIGLAKVNTKARVTFTSAHSDTLITISPDQSATSLPTQYTSTSSDAAYHGWNLIGNPFYSPLNTLFIYAPYMLITDNKSSDHRNPYILVSPYAEPNIDYETSALVPPFTPFFIQTPRTSLNIAPQASSLQTVTSDPIYHFNIVCTTPDSSQSVLTILSHNSFTEDYEIGSDLLSLTPGVSITHEGQAIYASNIGVGDTITFTLPSSRATLALGTNILIPENWGIRFLPGNRGMTIFDNTDTAIDIVTEDIVYDTNVTIFTIDGRLVYKGLYGEFSLTPGIYIIKTTSGQTHKTVIK